MPGAPVRNVGTSIQQLGLRINSLVPNPLASVVVQSPFIAIVLKNFFRVARVVVSRQKKHHEALRVLRPPRPGGSPASEERPLEREQHGPDGGPDQDGVRSEERRGVLYEVQGSEPSRSDLPQRQLQGKCQPNCSRPKSKTLAGPTLIGWSYKSLLRDPV